MTIKEAAKEILKAHCSSCYTRECKGCAYNTALLAMLHPSDNWTPCSVALPTRAGRADWELMAFNCTLSNGVVVTLEWEESVVRGKLVKRWRFMRGGICEYTVLAWQPLPEPYRGEA